MRIYPASDHAIGTDKKRNDATVMLIGGVDKYGDIWLLDVWWERQGSDRQVETMLRLAKHWKPLLWHAEKGHISKAIGPFLRDRMQSEKVYFSINEVTPIENKVQRAQSAIVLMSLKKIKFPKGAPWVQKAIDELMKFPNGRNDDFVDALSWLCRSVDRMAKPSSGRAPEKYAKPGTLGALKESARRVEQRKRLEASLKGW